MRAVIAFALLGLAAAAWPQTGIVDDFDTTPDTVNDALGVWYTFTDGNGGSATLTSAEGLAGTPHALHCTGRSGTRDAYIGFGVELSQGAAADVDISVHQTLEFDAVSAIGGDFKVRIEDNDNTYDSPHARFSLQPGQEKHIAFALAPLTSQSSPGVIDLARARRIVWVLEQDAPDTAFDLTVDGVTFGDRLPALVDDFSDADRRTEYLGWWFPFDSGGDLLTLTVDDVLHVVSQGALPADCQWAGFSAKLTDPSDLTVNLAEGGGFSTLHFRAQATNGSGTDEYRVRLEPGGENVRFTAGGDGAFADVSIPFTQFGAGFDPSHVSGIAWDIDPAGGRPFGLTLDDVRFE